MWRVPSSSMMKKASTKVIAMKTGKKYEPLKNETGNRGNC
jgi:hypothetical protein